jgi:hypothetical protein
LPGGIPTDQYVDSALARFRDTATGAVPPVLLLSGSGGWRLAFHAMVPVLAERHMVVALDPPGPGRTRVLDPQLGYDADAIARSIAGFLNCLGWSARRSWALPGRRVRAADPDPGRARGSPDVKDVDTPHAPEVLPRPRAHPRDPDRRRGA